MLVNALAVPGDQCIEAVQWPQREQPMANLKRPGLQTHFAGPSPAEQGKRIPPSAGVYECV